MKTSIILKSVTAVVILIFAANFCFAGNHKPKNTNELKTIIKKHIEYPEFAKENKLSGFVVVAFNIDNTGKITVNEINSNSYYFLQYVENKLGELVLENPQDYVDKTLYYRFDFQLLNRN